MNALEVGQQSKPRYEFRSFGQAFDAAHHRMARLSIPVPEAVWERHSDETYILSRTNDVNNTKIRDGKMDIKTLVDIQQGLEQWSPLMKAEFPIQRSLLIEQVIPAFQVEMTSSDQEVFSLGEFLKMIRMHPELQSVRVHKKRFGYMVNDTICEFGYVLINGARVATINSESTELDDIQRTLDDIGLEGVENINYLQAIKRVIGIIDKPLAN